MQRHLMVVAASLALLASALVTPAAGARASTKPHTFSFYARVVRSSSKGLQVRTKSGKRLWFSAGQIRRAKPTKPKCVKRKGGHKKCQPAKPSQGQKGKTGHAASGPSVTINVVGLQPGVTVLITETVDPAGHVTITITLPPAAVAGQQQTASGTITDVGDDAFVLQTADGSDLRLHMTPDALSSLNLSSCDEASVTYHQAAGMLIADGVQVTGSSSSGDCTPVSDATGAITSVSGSGLTISTDSGTKSFTVDSSDITGGFQVGDVVDVTYDGNQVASDVEYVEQDATGTVSSVNASSLTITDDVSGQPETFVAGQGTDIQTGVFDGVQPGDGVDVSYHVSAGKLVADAVDNGSGGG